MRRQQFVVVHAHYTRNTGRDLYGDRNSHVR
jgi:hypothetical protein